jgi:hypothetical protein
VKSWRGHFIFSPGDVDETNLINVYNKLTPKLDDDLEAVEDQAKLLNESIQSASLKAFPTRLNAQQESLSHMRTYQESI